MPQLISFDDELLVIEMTVVEPPFIPDFAGAYIGKAPDFPPEVIEQWRMEKREEFGDRWPEVESALDWLRSRLGVQLLGYPFMERDVRHGGGLSRPNSGLTKPGPIEALYGRVCVSDPMDLPRR